MYFNRPEIMTQGEDNSISSGNQKLTGNVWRFSNGMTRNIKIAYLKRFAGILEAVTAIASRKMENDMT